MTENQIARVALTAAAPGSLVEIALHQAPTTIADALALGADLAESDGSTVDLWEAFATIGAYDLGMVRALEPQVDALGILREAELDQPPQTWGVFAAEGGEHPLTATRQRLAWSLTGLKPWCSLAGNLDAALVTAHVGDGQRQLFAVQLSHAGVTVLPGSWAARGLTEIPSGPVEFEGVAAIPVGDPGWYLERPGFAWGGIGVAACWYGGAVGIGRTVHAAASAKPNPHLLAHLGAVDELLQSCRRALAEAAAMKDEGNAQPRLTAKRVRATVARACEEIIDRAGHALGPAPLALDPAHSKRIADLQLYVRQFGAERDQESLGSAIAADVSPW